MKILSLEMEGFGPFKDAQFVDFTAFDDSRIFLIGGRTGAGKSTILDAICFALYSSVPRYGGYSGAARLRSDHCEVDDVTRVTLTFEANDEIYRIVRNPEYERPKARGTGTTTEPASVELAIRDSGDGWEVLETKIPEVARRIDEIVKLNEKQFLQVILLAQNRFQEFLEAESKDRQSLLRTLFGTQRFELYSEALERRAKAKGEQLYALTGDAARTVEDIVSELQTEPPLEDEDRLMWANGALVASATTLRAAQEFEAQTTAQAQAAAVRLRAAEQLADRQKRRGDAQARLDALAARAETHARDRGRLEAAERAAAVEQLIKETDSALAALTRARADELAALEGVEELPEGDLAEVVTAIGQTIGSLTQALETEPGLPRLTAVADDTNAALTAHDKATAEIDDRRISLREHLSDLEDREGPAAAAAKDLSAAEAHLTSTQTARTAAARLADLQTEIERLTQAEVIALTERTEATRQDGHLRTLQLQGRAAVLAESLVDGEPCPVCGAVEHPLPTQAGAGSVSDEQVAAAHDRLERARVAVDLAARERAGAESRAAEQHGAAGGRTLAELDAQLGAADGRLRTARAAQHDLDAAAKERAEFNQALEDLQQQERTAATRRAELAQAATLAAKALSEAQDLLKRTRGEHSSVAARANDLKHRRDALERLITARHAVARAQAASDAVVSSLDARLDERGFSDRAAAVAVMLPGAERETLSKAIRAHEDGLTQSRAVLEQEDLQELPEGPADVSSAIDQSRTAEAARSAAMARRVTLEGRTKRARELTARLEAELERYADIEGEFKLLNGLAGAVSGDPGYNEPAIPLESFVLAAELEEIVAAANGRLRAMSQNRYEIEHSAQATRRGKRTGLEIVVYDAHTGATRSPRSLSGGEKFLASLALALGLAEVVTSRAGGIQLDTLFIDEGFGSLDNETLEVAMNTLDELRQGGRTVGLISHVEAMKDQIPAKLLVDVADGGWSVIRQEAFALTNG